MWGSTEAMYAVSRVSNATVLLCRFDEPNQMTSTLDGSSAADVGSSSCFGSHSREQGVAVEDSNPAVYHEYHRGRFVDEFGLEMISKVFHGLYIVLVGWCGMIRQHGLFSGPFGRDFLL